MKKYLFIVLILGMVILTGCQGSPLLNSSVAIRDSILPEYIELVKESDKYTKVEKKYRIRNAESYIKVIDAAAKKR